MLTSRERIAVDCQVLLALGMPRLIERIFKLTEKKSIYAPRRWRACSCCISSLCEAEWASPDSGFLRFWSERQRRCRGRFNCSTSKRRNPPTERIPEVKSRTRKHQDRCVRPNAVQHV